MLALNLQCFASDGDNKPAHRGEYDISRKAIAQGMPECLRFTCMLVCAFLCATCTRDRGCSAHPAFPAPSVLQRDNEIENLGQNMPRERETAFARARLHTLTVIIREGG